MGETARPSGDRELIRSPAGIVLTAATTPAGDLAAFVERHLASPPARVLEVGCGRGELARAIGRLGHSVVASRSLHHIADLGRALDKIARLLRAGGVVIVNEHAWDRLDEPTARWYLAKRAAAEPVTSTSLNHCLAEWERDHAGLHGYAAMRRELDRRFRARFFAWTPYLYGELAGAADEDEERSLIEAGAIQATGFRYVGELPGRPTRARPLPAS